MSQWKRNNPLGRNPANGRSTPLYRAIGLGSSRSGAEHWWLQRVTAVALVPLSLWFVASIVARSNADYQTAADWLGQPVVATIMILFLIATFWHVMLGLRVVVEDYVHGDRLKVAALLAINLACWVLMAAGVFACMYVAFH